MDITPLVDTGSQIIQGYGSGKFRISGAVYDSAVLVTPAAVRTWSFAGQAGSLQLSDFEGILDAFSDVDVVLFGCGATGGAIPGDIRKAFAAKGIAMEPMDTGAACRTYNVLMAEGRRVAALLIPVG